LFIKGAKQLQEKIMNPSHLHIAKIGALSIFFIAMTVVMLTTPIFSRDREFPPYGDEDGLDHGSGGSGVQATGALVYFNTNELTRIEGTMAAACNPGAVSEVQANNLITSCCHEGCDIQFEPTRALSCEQRCITSAQLHWSQATR